MTTNDFNLIGSDKLTLLGFGRVFARYADKG